MSKVLIEEQTLYDIGDAIREKNGEVTTYKPGEMVSTIRNLKGNLDGLNYNANGGARIVDGTYATMFNSGLSYIYPLYKYSVQNDSYFNDHLIDWRKDFVITIRYKLGPAKSSDTSVLFGNKSESYFRIPSIEVGANSSTLNFYISSSGDTWENALMLDDAGLANRQISRSWLTCIASSSNGVMTLTVMDDDGYVVQSSTEITGDIFYGKNCNPCFGAIMGNTNKSLGSASYIDLSRTSIVVDGKTLFGVGASAL